MTRRGSAIVSDGSLTVIASNALHSYTDVFASPRFAVPLSSFDGSKIFTVASPLQVPQIYAVLRFRVDASHGNRPGDT